MWFFKDRENYKHKSLPHGKDLVGEDLRRSLKEVFERYTYHAEKLAPSGSTQIYESFNQMVAAKAPKARHYSSSESLSCRLEATICIENEGQKYVADVFQKLKIPVSTETRVYAARLIRKAKLRKHGESSKEFKRRRNQLPDRKKRHEFSLALREGPSYEPRIALEDSEDHDKIPDPIWKPIIERVNPSAECIFVAFDLETTSLSTKSSIAQTASTFQGKSFSVYILPSQPFTKETSNVTRLSMLEGKLYYRGTEVEAAGLEKGLKQFSS